ncbi:hypothetical protein RFI_06162 [Reticulomyxa filosa]|uniref:TRAF-type domain-containing protein n=1 Tax=Reticulomyxa filosa TaxID=46433 RepID=X6P0A9_RETFI|nr:hypothetical protein RFI_06162 [Reticulomyxa filosa]|eukprot:ETO30957.1 hypothetical protein RFI_06162 [Reticulomyxa filosa]
MLLVEEEQESKEDKKTSFSFSECYGKAWVSFTNESKRLDTLICCICNQIANNAMELHCDEHENADQVYLVGEQCLQSYLKQNNGKCPIQQHDHCKFSQGKIKDLKDHLDKSCNLIPIKQNISSEIGNELNIMSEKIKELQLQLKDMKDKDYEKNKQIEQMNVLNFYFI